MSEHLNEMLVKENGVYNPHKLTPLRGEVVHKTNVN